MHIYVFWHAASVPFVNRHLPRKILIGASMILSAIFLFGRVEEHSGKGLLAGKLEFLGMMGMAREFARGPKNVETCYKRILSRRDGIQNRFTLPRAQEIARIKLKRMETCLGWLIEESYGVL